jgi:hypothetical protein
MHLDPVELITRHEMKILRRTPAFGPPVKETVAGSQDMTFADQKSGAVGVPIHIDTPDGAPGIAQGVDDNPSAILGVNREGAKENGPPGAKKSVNEITTPPSRPNLLFGIHTQAPCHVFIFMGANSYLAVDMFPSRYRHPEAPKEELLKN